MQQGAAIVVAFTAALVALWLGVCRFDALRNRLYRAWREGRVPATPAVQRHGQQFSLRALLLLTVLVGAMLGALGSRDSALTMLYGWLFAAAGGLWVAMDYTPHRGLGPLRGAALSGMLATAACAVLFPIVKRTISYCLAAYVPIGAVVPHGLHWWACGGVLLGLALGCLVDATRFLWLWTSADSLPQQVPEDWQCASQTSPNSKPWLALAAVTLLSLAVHWLAYETFGAQAESGSGGLRGQWQGELTATWMRLSDEDELVAEVVLDGNTAHPPEPNPRATESEPPLVALDAEATAPAVESQPQPREKPRPPDGGNSELAGRFDIFGVVRQVVSTGEWQRHGWRDPRIAGWVAGVVRDLKLVVGEDGVPDVPIQYERLRIVWSANPSYIDQGTVPGLLRVVTNGGGANRSLILADASIRADEIKDSVVIARGAIHVNRCENSILVAAHAIHCEVDGESNYLKTAGRQGSILIAPRVRVDKSWGSVIHAPGHVDVPGRYITLVNSATPAEVSSGLRQIHSPAFLATVSAEENPLADDVAVVGIARPGTATLRVEGRNQTVTFGSGVAARGIQVDGLPDWRLTMITPSFVVLSKDHRHAVFFPPAE